MLQTTDMQKWGKQIIDSSAIRNQTDDIQLIMTIVGYDLLGVKEVIARFFNFKQDLWFLHDNNKLTEETFNDSVKWFNQEYDGILDYLNRFKFSELKPILETVTQLNEDNKIHEEVCGNSFTDLFLDLKKTL